MYVKVCLEKNGPLKSAKNNRKKFVKSLYEVNPSKVKLLKEGNQNDPSLRKFTF